MSDAMPEERWLPVVGWEGKYEVSDLGRVRTVPRVVMRSDGTPYTVHSRIRKSQKGWGASPYAKVRLGGLRDYKNHQIHILVAEAFIGPRPPGMECCHNNGDDQDNRAVNLRWDTPLENQRDIVRHGHNHNQNVTHCPRGHELAPWNLAPWTLRVGRRECYACNLARNKWRYEKSQGREWDWLADADRRFAMMGRSAAA